MNISGKPDMLLYGSETWTLYSYEIKHLRTVQQRHLRSILKILWNDFVSNGTVFTRSNVVDIETLVAQNRLRWLSHLCRMGDDRTIKLILYCELAEGSRSVGRPKLRYKDNLKTILKNVNILETWSNSVHDSSEWR